MVVFNAPVTSEAAVVAGPRNHCDLASEPAERKPWPALPGIFTWKRQAHVGDTTNKPSQNVTTVVQVLLDEPSSALMATQRTMESSELEARPASFGHLSNNPKGVAAISRTSAVLSPRAIYLQGKTIRESRIFRIAFVSGSYHSASYLTPSHCPGEGRQLHHSGSWSRELPFVLYTVIDFCYYA